MTSPFPGMDPFIESQALWPDFHAKLINYLQEALADVLPTTYEVRIDERVNFVQVQDERVQRVRPDVSIAQVVSDNTAAPLPSGVATLEPVTLPETIEEEVRETYIEIHKREDRSLVTILEVLSPAHKEGGSRAVYQAKRAAILQQSVHLVELDLLRAGQRHQFKRALPRGDFYAMVSRVEKRLDCDVYAWTMRDPLPTLPIPLAVPDPDVMLDLSAVFSLTYERGRYQQSIDYRQPLVPVLRPEDESWAAELIARSGS